MSIRALQALLGADTVAAMDPREVAELGEILDAEIMKHPEVRDRLQRVVSEAVQRIQQSKGS